MPWRICGQAFCHFDNYNLGRLCENATILCVDAVYSLLHSDICVGNTGSSLKSDENNDSGVTELELCAQWGTGPLISIGQSDRVFWEQAVLGNNLADRPRDGQGIGGGKEKE